MTRPVRRTHVDHHATAEHLRTHPQTWLSVGTYRSAASAKGIANDIITGTMRGGRGPSAYTPPGAYEARTELTEDEVRVIARYIGEGGAR